MLKSIEGNFDNPEVHELLTKHFVELRAASPEGSAHVLDIPGLKDKSIRIHDNFRRMGNGVNVINHLINEARKLDIKKLSIETGAGEFFKPARKLFKQCGFDTCDPFAHYKEDVNSVYLTKSI